MTDELFKAECDKYGDNYIGNVIRIIDARTIIANIGKDYISVGNIVQIYEPGEPLFDIDGTKLGQFDFVKEELKVIRVEENYSICRKMEKITKSLSYVLSPLLQEKTTEYLPMNVDESDIQELKIKNPTVKVGDPIKLA